MRITYLLFFFLLLFSCKNEDKAKKTHLETEVSKTKNPVIYPDEVHFKDLRQVTFGGDNAEAYWRFDDKPIIYVSTHLSDETISDTPLRKKGKYICPVYDTFGVFITDLQGNIVKQLTNEKG